MATAMTGSLYSITRFVFDVLLSGSCCIFGFVGNILALVILIKDKRKNSTVFLLAALAICDWIFLLYISIICVFPGICLYLGYSAYYNKTAATFQYIWPVGCMAQTAAIWLVLAVTMDRYIAICYPFKALKWCTSKNAKKAIAGIFVTSIIFNIPRFFHRIALANPMPTTFNSFPVGEDCIGVTCANIFTSPEVSRTKRDNTDGKKVYTTGHNVKTTKLHVDRQHNSQENISADVGGGHVYTISPHPLVTPRTFPAIKQPQHDILHAAWIEPVIFKNIAHMAVITPEEYYDVNDLVSWDNKSYNTGVDYNSTSPVMGMASIRGSFGLGFIYRYVYYIALTWLFVYIVPIVSLFVLNILLIKAVKASKVRHAQLTKTRMGPEEKDNLSATLNIVAVVTVFLICQTPDFIQIFIGFPAFSINKKTMMTSLSVSLAFLAFNASINFIIYCLFYKKFRRIVKSLMCAELVSRSTGTASTDV